MPQMYSRKTVLAAINALPFTHADLTRFLLELGPEYATRAGESISVQKRLNELMSVYDMDPEQRSEDGEFLSDFIVAKAASFMKPLPQYAWSEPPEERAEIKALRAALARDGFTVVDGTIRRILPVELGIAEAEDETTYWLKMDRFQRRLGIWSRRWMRMGVATGQRRTAKSVRFTSRYLTKLR
jgi:hypothetical protein